MVCEHGVQVPLQSVKTCNTTAFRDEAEIETSYYPRKVSSHKGTTQDGEIIMMTNGGGAASISDETERELVGEVREDM